MFYYYFIIFILSTFHYHCYHQPYYITLLSYRQHLPQLVSVPLLAVCVIVFHLHLCINVFVLFRTLPWDALLKL